MPTFTRRAAATASFALLAAPALRAQSARPLRLLVPFPAGGTMDVQARLFAPLLAERLGVNVVVDNRGGGGTVIATQEAARAPLDQPTLLMVANSFTINPTLHGNLPYDIFRDFHPVALASVIPHALAVHPSVPARDVREFLELARARPGELSYASYGTGTSNHLNTELLAQRAGVSFTHVPYRGFVQWFPDLLQNRVQFTIANLPEVVPPGRDGRLRLLAVAHDARVPALPDTLTLAEAGAPPIVSNSWFAFVVPRNTPEELRARIEAALLDLLRLPAVTSRLEELWITPLARDGQHLANFLRDQHGLNAEAIRLSGARAS